MLEKFSGASDGPSARSFINDFALVYEQQFGMSPYGQRWVDTRLYLMPCLTGLAKEELELASVTTFDAACELLIKRFGCTKERCVARLMALRL